MAEELREVPIVDVAHPLVDQVGTAPDGTRWVATESRAPVIFANPARINLLSGAAATRRRVALVTDEHSRLTPTCADLWVAAGAGWAVRDVGGGLRDGFSGRRLGSVADLWTAAPLLDLGLDELAVRHLGPLSAEVLELVALVSTRLPARAETVLGTALTTLTATVEGSAPRLWGPHEPVGMLWNPAAMTQFVRSRMPLDTMVMAATDAGTATVTGRRTEHGVEEVTHLHVAAGEPTDGSRVRVGERVDEALRRLAETTMPLAALTLARPARRDLTLPPFLQVPPVPLSLLVGAPTVRSMDLHLDKLGEEFGAERVGRPRLPGLLFPLASYGDGWGQLDRVLSAVGADGVLGPLGPAARVLRASGPRRPPGGDDDAQP